MHGFPRALLALTFAFVLCEVTSAAAHGIAGNRFFPATIATDDPAVADELSLPTVAWAKDEGTNETEISGEFSKRITPNLGLSFEGAWTHIAPPGGPDADGFQNLGTTLKYQFLKSAAHETILSAGIDVDWGGSGAEAVGAERVTKIAPTSFFGKGFGDLPAGLDWAKPFAITGLIGYEVPVRAHDGLDPIPNVLSTGVALEYSMRYLSGHVHDYGLPEFVNRLTPVIEASFETPVARSGGEHTTGTINPGLLWSGRHFQIGAEAIMPINKASGKTVGVAVQLHWFIDDLFPHSLGAPLFGGGS